MNRTTKIILVLLAGLTFLCLSLAITGLWVTRSAASYLDHNLNTAPVKAREIADSIADFTLPEGFGNPFALQLGFFSMVSYTGKDGHSHIYFIQAPSASEIDQGEIQRQLQQVTPSQGLQLSKVIGHKQATIRGQDVTLVVSEGVSSSGLTFRQASGVFQGKGGPAMVIYSRPTSAWNEIELDQFLASIQ